MHALLSFGPIAAARTLINTCVCVCSYVQSIHPSIAQVRSRKAKEKMLTGKVMLSSVQMQIQMQVSTIKVAGCMQKSSEIMKSMNRCVRTRGWGHA